MQIVWNDRADKIISTLTIVYQIMKILFANALKYIAFDLSKIVWYQ